MRVRSPHTVFRLTGAALQATLLAGWFPALANTRKQSPANPGQAVPTVPVAGVQGVRYRCEADQAQVVINLEAAVRYAISRLSNPFLCNRHGKAKNKNEGASATTMLNAFNVLNHVNFGQPVGNLSSPFFRISRYCQSSPAHANIFDV